MTERGEPPAGKTQANFTPQIVGDSEFKQPSSYSLNWWHWGLGIALIIILTLLTPRSQSPEFAHLVEGSVSQVKIIAPFDFEILKNNDELENERREAAAVVLPVMARNDSIGNFFVHELLSFARESHRVLLASNLSTETTEDNHRENSLSYSLDTTTFREQRNILFQKFGFRLGTKTWDFLQELFVLDRTTSPGSYYKYFETVLARSLRDLYSQGIFNVPRQSLAHSSGKAIVLYEGEEAVVDLSLILTFPEAMEKISSVLPERMKTTFPVNEPNAPNQTKTSSLPTGGLSAGYEILQSFVSSNVIFDSVETDNRRQAAIAKVPLARGFVKKDELIIDKNHLVKPEHTMKLRSLAIKRAEIELEKGGISIILPILGYAVVFTLIVALFFIFTALMNKEVWNNSKLLSVTVLIIVLAHLAWWLTPFQFEYTRYLFPAAVAAMMIAILIDRTVALGAVALMALSAGMLRGYDYHSAFVALVTGSAALFGIRHVQNRGDVMQASIYLLIALLPMTFAFRLTQYSVDERIWSEIAAAGANVIFSPVLVLGLVYFFERLFRLTTDFTLVELVDLNHPLLQELSVKSPGTYHHSIMVGSLAESAARAIGANALLTRAGAYYHDIGKMVNKEYFIENQETGSENIHDKLPPSESAAIVINHVTRGIEIAEKFRLPPQVTAFISEHHGTTLATYFYSKAIKERGIKIKDDTLFRYPGPKPQSRETGILMLADVVEAATRVMGNRTVEEVRETVSKLVRSRMTDGDLDQCPLTLHEVNIIADAFVQTLSGIHHQRISYPNNPEIKQNTESENSDNSETLTQTGLEAK